MTHSIQPTPGPYLNCPIAFHQLLYFLLDNLSFTEICYISSTMPKMLWNLLSGDKAISFTGCLLQMYFFVALGGTECVLLSATVYDCYAAICHPLRYIILMRRCVYAWLLGALWFIGHLNSVINTAMVFSQSFCGTVEIHHFFCNIPPLLQLSCSDTSLSQLVTFSVSGCVIILPFCLTLLSYLLILSSILKAIFQKDPMGPSWMIPGNWSLAAITEVVLLGFFSLRQQQLPLFLLYLIVYTLTLLGNSLVSLMICVNRRLHMPMYCFLSYLSLEMLITTTITPKMLSILLENVTKTKTEAKCNQ
ncbi:olfactory receptor 6N1-like [Terrapene carolina triunguis]|uniref:olfactory receptor 6N1-like n=1 Tax=Terrapene triunguis TaxID=2587831 RepID=UPI00115611A3|nr:olfactory receptor 6N1-like [Terrapene carolina triunguis]